MADIRSGSNVGKGAGLGISLQAKEPVTEPTAKEGLLPVKEFVIRAIKGLRRDGKGGIHTVFSNFNVAFEKYYGKPSGSYTGKTTPDGKPEWKPCPEIQALIDGMVIESRPAKVWINPKNGKPIGGAVLYLYGEEPNHSRVDATLKTILG